MIRAKVVTRSVALIAAAALWTVAGCSSQPISGDPLAGGEGGTVAESDTDTSDIDPSDTDPSPDDPTNGVDATETEIAPEPDSPGELATIIMEVTPFTDDGELRIPRDADAEPTIDLCFGSSVAVGPNVHACGTVPDYLPACWPIIEQWLIACMHLPTDDTVVLASANDQLDVVDAAAAPVPWAVALDDGSQCSVLLGEALANAPNDYSWSYQCDGPTEALLSRVGGSTFAQQHGHWQAYTAPMLDDPYASYPEASVDTVGVASVTYAGAAPDTLTPQTGKQCPSDEELSALLQADEWLDPNIETSCVGDWASHYVYVGHADGDEDEWYVRHGLFQKSADQYVSATDEGYIDCDTQMGIPAAFLAVCWVG